MAQNQKPFPPPELTAINTSVIYILFFFPSAFLMQPSLQNLVTKITENMLPR